MFEKDIEQLFTTGSALAGVIAFITILWFVLSVILFFKIWNMTNDVSKIKDMLKEWLELEHPLNENDSKSPTDKNSN
jgi:hypothetical protein